MIEVLVPTLLMISQRLSDWPTTEVFHLQGLLEAVLQCVGTWLPGRCLGPPMVEMWGGDGVPAKYVWKHLWVFYAEQ